MSFETPEYHGTTAIFLPLPDDFPFEKVDCESCARGNGICEGCKSCNGLGYYYLATRRKGAILLDEMGGESHTLGDMPPW